jgi:arsenate reductase-like glutaredoxin family protein
MLDNAEIAKYYSEIKKVISSHSDLGRASSARRALSALLKEVMSKEVMPNREIFIDAQRLMQHAVYELRRLRALADRMSVQLEIVDIFREALSRQELREGMATSEDVACRLERFMEIFSQVTVPEQKSPQEGVATHADER